MPYHHINIINYKRNTLRILMFINIKGVRLILLGEKVSELFTLQNNDQN